MTEEPGNPQRIIGYVNFKDIVACMRLSEHNPSIRSVLRPMPTLPEGMTLSVALEQMIREHTHIALIQGGSGQQGLPKKIRRPDHLGGHPRGTGGRYPR